MKNNGIGPWHIFILLFILNTSSGNLFSKNYPPPIAIINLIISPSFILVLISSINSELSPSKNSLINLYTFYGYIPLSFTASATLSTPSIEAAVLMSTLRSFDISYTL